MVFLSALLNTEKGLDIVECENQWWHSKCRGHQWEHLPDGSSVHCHLVPRCQDLSSISQASSCEWFLDKAAFVSEDISVNENFN